MRLDLVSDTHRLIILPNFLEAAIQPSPYMAAAIKTIAFIPNKNENISINPPAALPNRFPAKAAFLSLASLNHLEKTAPPEEKRQIKNCSGD